MDFGEFAKIRLIRLGPLFYAGLGLGVLAFLAKHSGGAGAGDWLPFIVAIVLEALFLPTILPLTAPGWVGNWPINQPSWSLTFELGVNFFYALIARRLTTTLLYILIAISAVGIIMHVVMLDSVRGGDTILDFPDLLLRITRTTFSFFVGVLLSRTLVTREKTKPLPLFFGLSAILVASLAIHTQGVTGIWEAACVMLVFPAIIWLGAYSTAPKAAPILSFLGDLSYPVYILHFPIMRVVNSLVRSHVDPQHQIIVAYVITMSLTLVFATLAMLFFDKPVRAFLTRGFAKRPPPSSRPARFRTDVVIAVS
jgi:peptidoglycan/LPS O-acetylase OafA/YrhL